MTCFRLISFSALLLFLISTSCTKTETITKIETRTDTLVKTKTDTLEVAAKDTTFIMNVASWDYFSNPNFLAPSSTTYMTTSEGVKFIPQYPRAGVRLQVKNEVGFKDKNIYFKWKANGGGQFTDIVISIKYVATAGDSTPPIQGLDFDGFSTNNSFNGTTLIQPDIWYFTRIIAIKGTNNYQVVTCSGDYDNKGGTPISTKTAIIYTKHGYPAIRLGEPYAGSSAYIVLGECKIAGN